MSTPAGQHRPAPFLPTCPLPRLLPAGPKWGTPSRSRAHPLEQEGLKLDKKPVGTEART